MRMSAGRLWDVFCHVIDNHGDIGVCWRLACGLAAGGQRVRLWVDNPSALNWMAPEGRDGVDVIPWSAQVGDPMPPAADVLVEAFGCEINPELIANYASSVRSRALNHCWINLEYLSAESYVERCHGLPSPVQHGPGGGLLKFFYYPGYTPSTGGLLREPDLARRQQHFQPQPWLARIGVPADGVRCFSLFCYEPAALGPWLLALAQDGSATRLLVTAGRSTAAVRAEIARLDGACPGWNCDGRLKFIFLPLLTQTDFDHLLWSCELNLVRGEDSLVRAMWAGRPFVWQAYPQSDEAHHAKLKALLDRMDAPTSLRAFHQAWNGVVEASPALWQGIALPEWAAAVQGWRENLLRQEDLVSQLLRFVSETT
ncbi:MAG: elongation factor P maturation arginine rhamnosyltransferase EarP [Rhodoferax sp.]|nr:elongation factor P maturation arginine rhamnosyltransferase EarP [Rhodoferax sp.]